MEWNEVTLQLAQAWIVLVAGGVLIVSLFYLVAAALSGSTAARVALKNFHAVAEKYVEYVDEPDDLIIRRFVDMVALTGKVKISPESAAELVPGFVKWLGEKLSEGNDNGDPQIVSKAD